MTTITITIDEEGDKKDFAYALNHNNYYTLGELVIKLRDNKKIQVK